MCVAVPMKVIKIDKVNNTAEVSLSGNFINVNISLVSPKVGDFVLVHAGCAIEIIEKQAAEEIIQLFDTLEQLATENTND